MYICMYICMYIYVYSYAYLHMYVHTRMYIASVRQAQHMMRIRCSRHQPIRLHCIPLHLPSLLASPAQRTAHPPPFFLGYIYMYIYVNMYIYIYQRGKAITPRISRSKGCASTPLFFGIYINTYICKYVYLYISTRKECRKVKDNAV